MQTMTTDALVSLIAETDARIRDLDRLMATTPSDTVAHAAMAESRPGLIRFRNGLDDVLATRGA